jgi:uroporphyrinogen decarboxylase
MKPVDITDWIGRVLSAPRAPDFERLLTVLRRQSPDRPVLFEFHMNNRIVERLAGCALPGLEDRAGHLAVQAKAYRAAGFDHVLVSGQQFGFWFPGPKHVRGPSASLDRCGCFSDRAGMERYPWPDPESLDRRPLQNASLVPGGMRLVMAGPMGVLENVIVLLGYEQLCLLTEDDPDFLDEVFERVGSRFVRFYEIVANEPATGAVIVNDDWGFKTGPMLTPAQMRRWVFPWHRRIVQTVHDAGRPAVLHSCGQLELLMEEIITDLRLDAKHSFEDNILPVESAWQRWGQRIALVGGVDVDFICRSDPTAVYRRACALLETTRCRGYALGSGNSVPGYVPDEAYCALLAAAMDVRF